MSPARRRLDRVLVERGLAASRPQAADLVDRGLVLVGGAVADKPARLVAPSDAVELRAAPPRYVSRGGEKLEGALARFGIEVAGLRVLDAGASTGGFSDCLLQAGAAQVVAVDVGHGQLHERLRADPRVTVLEATDIREVDRGTLGSGPVDAVVADLSFISLTSVLDRLLSLVRAAGPVVVLVKPQFEAGRIEASRGRGVIRDPEVHRRCLGRVADAVAAAGGEVVAAMPSPLTGRSGNREFFLHLERASAGDVAAGRAAVGTLLDQVVAEAHSAGQDDRAWG
ncbi:MAG: TlyA family RNA methyltransferase [Acidimicrobiales bacterium]|nr:TlyA family RNA methyltransferase [Acidimicrobiales bacterium]